MSDQTNCIECGAPNTRRLNHKTQCWRCGHMHSDAIPNWTGYAPKVGESAAIPAGTSIYRLEEDGDWLHRRLKESGIVHVYAIDGHYVIISDEDEEPVLGILLKDWDQSWEESKAFPTTTSTSSISAKKTISYDEDGRRFSGVNTVTTQQEFAGLTKDIRVIEELGRRARKQGNPEYQVDAQQTDRLLLADRRVPMTAQSN